MVNFLNQIFHPQLKHELFFEVMRDIRKGGLNPEMYNDFIQVVRSLPPIHQITPEDILKFNQFNLNDISEDDFVVITRKVKEKGINKSKICWHPEASSTTCKVNNRGKIIISKAHSIQNNGVLSKIAKEGQVMTYNLEKSGFEGRETGKSLASIFWGFCNKHDVVFSPIEINPYTQTLEQNFLFAYRGFVVSSHVKLEVSQWMDFGEQSSNDISENKKIFDKAILEEDYSVIETEIFELQAHYPVAVSSSFYLDYDFEGNQIPHSEERMEDLFVTLFPTENKTYFLLSYFKQDRELYKELGNQIRARGNLKSDITMLIAAHVENIYFHPDYYDAFIKQHEEVLSTIMYQTQMDIANLDDEGNVHSTSVTPNNYLQNIYNINFFGY
jgi:hypothetical protein